MNRDKGLQLYNIKELLNNKYVIPIYQRNFAWTYLLFNNSLILYNCNPLSLFIIF